MLRLLKVSGESLSPVYQDGDFVLIAKIPLLFKEIHRGDVIAFHHEIYGTMIKQVDDISIDGERFIVTGTHENSVDSTQFGAISRDVIIGKVIWHIKRQNTTEEWENYSK
ncbi:MAG: S26 family signal peptidase [Anaerolineales bacterium]|jgi:signal peptidase I|nr:S26 family signal peptidase [Anaerolineales bacterium]